MVLQWIRCRDATFSKELKDHLSTDEPIAKLESKSKSSEKSEKKRK